MYSCRICGKEYPELSEAMKCENVCYSETEKKEKEVKRELKQKRINEIKRNIKEYQDIIKECTSQINVLEKELSEMGQTAEKTTLTFKNFSDMLDYMFSVYDIK